MTNCLFAGALPSASKREVNCGLLGDADNRDVVCMPVERPPSRPLNSTELTFAKKSAVWFRLFSLVCLTYSTRAGRVLTPCEDTS